MDLLYGITQLSYQGAVEFGRTVYRAVTTLPATSMYSADNLAMAAPLNVLITDLNNSTVSATTPVVVAERKINKKALGVFLKSMAYSYSTNAAGDPAMLAASGFPVRTQGTPNMSQMLTPQNVRIINPELTGELRPVCNADPRAHIYTVRMRILGSDDPFVQVGTFTNSRKMFIRGLTRGVEYEFQLMVTGPPGDSNWSQPVSGLCQ